MLSKKIIVFFQNLGYAARSLFWKKDYSCVVIDSWFGQKFADNSRYLYQYLSENRERYNLSHVVWVTNNESVLENVRSRGYEAYMLDSKESEYYHKRAKYHIANNAPMGDGRLTGEILYKLSYRAIRINLWHGTGVIKNLGFLSNDYINKTKQFPGVFKIKNWFYKNCSILRKFSTPLGAWGDCYFLATSISESKKLQSFFCLPEKRVITSGYPRDSYDCKRTAKEQEIIDVIKTHKVAILYLPTFRSASRGFNINELSEAVAPILAKNDAIFIQKAHTAAFSNSEYRYDNNILTLQSDFDINVLTPLMDFVITDYSSILADALFFNKPVLLYVPDYSDYMKSDRGFCEDAEYILSAAIKFNTKESLVSYLSEKIWNPNDAKPQHYEDIKYRIWGAESKTIDVIWNEIVKKTR